MAAKNFSVIGSLSAIGTTALRLVGDGTAGNAVNLQAGICIKAAAANTGKIYVGFSSAVTALGGAGSSAATDGFELAAGDSITLDKSAVACGVHADPDAQNLWVIGSASGQALTFLVF